MLGPKAKTNFNYIESEDSPSNNAAIMSLLKPAIVCNEEEEDKTDENKSPNQQVCKKRESLINLLVYMND